jgi:hypothetical protein
MKASCEIYHRETPFLGMVSTYYLKIRNVGDERIPRGRIRIWGILDEKSTPLVYLTGEIIPFDPNSEIRITCEMPRYLKYLVTSHYESNDEIILNVGGYFVNELFGIRAAKTDLESGELVRIYKILRDHGFY